MQIKNVFDFNKALDIGAYAWPGGYPHYFVCRDGAALCFAEAKKNARYHRDRIIFCDNDRIIGMEVNWEDTDLQCAETGVQIESAYGED